MAVVRLPLPAFSELSTLRILGLILTAFSGIVGLIVLFTPIGCTVVGAVELLICAFLFITGLIILAVSFFQKKAG